MPSTEDYLHQAESYKNDGNEQFRRHAYDDAISSYSQGVVALDRIATTTTPMMTMMMLKWTLLSNRALARIKRYEAKDADAAVAASGSGQEVTLLSDAVEDCQTAICSMSAFSSSSSSASSAGHGTSSAGSASTNSTTETNALRAKLLYRSAQARFLWANHPQPHPSQQLSTTAHQSPHNLLQDAAKDLLLLLQMDPQHTEGNRLMKVIRTQHHQQQQQHQSSPVGKICAALSSSLQQIATTTDTGTSPPALPTAQHPELLSSLKQLYALIQNDPLDASRQIERYHDDDHHHNSTNNGVQILWRIILTGLNDRNNTTDHHNTTSGANIALLGLQCLSSLASTCPVWVRTHFTASSSSQHHHHHQPDLVTAAELIQSHLSNTTATTKSKMWCDLMVSLLSIWHSVLLHSDRDPIQSNSNEITGTTKLEYPLILRTMSIALQMGQLYIQQSPQYTQSTLLYRAVMDILSVFLASTDRDHRIRMSLLQQHHSSSPNGVSQIDPELEPIRTPVEIRNLTPPQLAAYKKRQYDIKTRNEAWAYERAKLICGTVSGSENGPEICVFRQLCVIAVSHCNPDDIVFRREVTISISRLLSCLEPDATIHETVRPYLQHPHESMEAPYIQEIHNDYDEKEEEGKRAAIDEVTLEAKMIRAVISTAILLLTSKKECATWVLSPDGWKNVHTDVPDLIASQHTIALCYVVELIQAAAVLEATRTTVTSLVSSGSMEILMKSSHRDVRSGAAAAIAKLGLSDQITSKDDGELMGLLQAACELFDDRDANHDLDNNDDNDNVQRIESKKNKNNGSGGDVDKSKYNQYSSYATSSVERAVEMITYLVAHTTIKEEIAAGFGGSSGVPVIDLLVQAADQPGAGESMSGFSLASIFQLLAATNEQMRREAFEGKEVTMDQYDEMQRMGKTEEEKEIMDQEKDTDSKEACQERIRKMANANVPRALVALTENASEHTLEQLTMAMNRMADEASVRGIMIQQGVLSTCIKVEKAEGPTETDVMKKVIRTARHCIAKMLISTNPSLLTSAQKLGAVKPLILLIRDIKASDLQHFEALLAITNIGSSGDDAKNRIVSELGISTFHFAMFSDHEMVRRSATEALCNLVPHEKMMEHLMEVDHLRLWLAFAVDYEDHYECARAAAGCLAMATQDETIAQTLISLDKFKTQMTSLLESGRLEIMHRTFVIVYNLVLHGSKIRDAAIAAGLIDFCRAYIELQQHGVSAEEFSAEERNLIPVTVDIAKTIVKSADS